MATQTKYFAKEYNTEKGEFELIEIPLNRDNWFYVQLDSTVRTSFFKYGFPYPKYAIIEKISQVTSIIKPFKVELFSHIRIKFAKKTIILRINEYIGKENIS